MEKWVRDRLPRGSREWNPAWPEGGPEDDGSGPLRLCGFVDPRVEGLVRGMSVTDEGDDVHADADGEEGRGKEHADEVHFDFLLHRKEVETEAAFEVAV